MREIELDSDAVIEDVEATEVYVDGDVRFAEITGARLLNMELTGYLFEHLTLVDVVFDNCEISGASMLLESRLLRVQFNECRMSGFVGSNLTAQDVQFNRCKLDGVNMRMSKWDRVEFNDCEMQDADFMGASFDEVRIHNSRLQRGDFSRVAITSLALHGSILDNIAGATSLTKATIGSDQVLTLAYPLLAAMNIAVDDDF